MSWAWWTIKGPLLTGEGLSSTLATVGEPTTPTPHGGGAEPGLLSWLLVLAVGPGVT